MKRVAPYPSLPPGTPKAVQDALFDHAQALQDAADGRLQDFVSITAAYTAGVNDHVILAAPGAPFTITLPAASVMRNKRVVIKRSNNTTHTLTLQSSAGNIDGAASITMTVAYQVRELFSDGAAWHLISG